MSSPFSIDGIKVGSTWLNKFEKNEKAKCIGVLKCICLLSVLNNLNFIPGTYIYSLLIKKKMFCCNQLIVISDLTLIANGTHSQLGELGPVVDF